MRRVKINYRLLQHNRAAEEGFFHCWGKAECDDLDSDDAVSVAIVELESGKIELVEPDIIQFLDTTEKKKPEVVADYIERGWIFDYNHSTRFVGCTHPDGGKQSVCEIRNGFQDEAFGNAIADLLNGKRNA